MNLQKCNLKTATMKIGFPVLKETQLSELEFDLSLHRCKFFGVFDSLNESIQILHVDSLFETSAGMDLLNFLKEESIEFIISPEFHSMAARFFENNGIAVYKAVNSNVLLSIYQFQRKNLTRFGAADAIQKSACSSKCDSCNSTCNEIVQEVVAI
jgi:predicted Fe-Mo cluster-binding NifX family protein